MCGIAGFIQRLPDHDYTVESMAAAMAHRGPDGVGVWRGEWNGWSVNLAHTRLAIIDVRGGRQPMTNEDGSVRLTYNGEVYAYKQMRRDLAKRGHRFRTESDTEVVLHHLEDPAATIERRLRDLDGMFALALWNSANGLLTLARDRAGIKPLYFAGLPCGGIAFASELTALLRHAQVGRDIDPQALASYVFMDYCQAPGTMLRGVQKLEPAAFLQWRDGAVREHRTYWSPPRAEAHQRDGSELVETLRSKLRDSVESRLVSDVPVGVFLSGGIDSSLVAALACKASPTPLKSFTIRFADREFDQSDYARTMAAHIGSELIEEPLTTASLLDDLDAALSCLDEPMADPSVLPTFVMSRLAARHVKVVLGGDGPDELWGGYPTLKALAAAPLYRLIPPAIRRGMIEPLVRSMRVRDGYQTIDWKARHFVLRWDEQPLARHLRWMASADLADLAKASRGTPTLPAAFAPFCDRPLSGDLVNDILRLDFETYLPGAVLAKVDRASMAFGLEVRPPLLSNDLIDFAFSLGSRVKARGRRTKILLRKAAAEVVPSSIVHRRKMGFPIPLARWIRGPLDERLGAVIKDSPLWNTGLLDQTTYATWRREHEQRTADRSRPLWALLVLDHWWKRIVAGSQPPRPRITRPRPLPAPMPSN